MQQPQLNAYLNLIQELLTCPQGEEWIRLKQHEDLVDAQFLQVVEQVATQLARQGDRESAIFLHHWAAKLHHILLQEVQTTPPETDKADAYLALIQKLLTSPDGLEEDILQEHQALIGPGLVHKMHQVARQFILQGEVETAQFLERLAHQLNQRWLQAHDFQAANLQKAATKPPEKPPIAATQSVSSRTAAEGDILPVPDIAAPPTSTAVHPEAPPPIEKPDLSDPWDAPTDAATEPTSSPPAESAPAPPETTATPPVELDGSQAIAAGLNAIATALQQLTETLAEPRRSQTSPTEASPHPLWYLEVLEQACSQDWQLTTEEVEQLIGVKPHCHKEETVYERGNWCFTKVGKLGGQNAWQVSKLS
jgi:hypothetical protein